MHTFCTFALAAALAALTTLCLPMARPASADKALIPDGTPVHFAILKDLKSGGSKAGEVVPFAVTRDVYGPNRTLLIAADTPAFGKILQSNRRGMFGQGGKLKFTIDYILVPDQTHIPLRADPQLVRGQDNRGSAIATAVLLNVFGVFVNGRDVSVKKGQEFTMYVDAPGHAPSPLAPPVLVPPVLGARPPAPMAALPRTAAAPAIPAGAPQSLFVFANGGLAVGTVVSYDGSVYTLSTTKGMRQFKTAAIKSITPLSAATRK